MGVSGEMTKNLPNLSIVHSSFAKWKNSILMLGDNAKDSKLGTKNGHQSLSSIIINRSMFKSLSGSSTHCTFGTNKHQLALPLQPIRSFPSRWQMRISFLNPFHILSHDPKAFFKVLSSIKRLLSSNIYILMCVFI